MKAFAIAIPTSKVSMAGYEELKESYDKYGHEEGIELFEAIVVVVKLISDNESIIILFISSGISLS